MMRELVRVMLLIRPLLCKPKYRKNITMKSLDNIWYYAIYFDPLLGL